MSTVERPAKVLSCSSCRARKIKCSKVQPQCLECERAEIQCIYPSRRPTRRAPKPRQKELLDRISRLESIVGQADQERRAQPEHASVTDASRSDPPTAHARPSGRLDAVPQPVARYLSSEFWGNLSEEVEAIKQALEQTSSDDEDNLHHDASSPSNPSPADAKNTPSGYTLGNPDHHERPPLAHPKPDIILRFWALYCRNCDPIIKILHQPSMEQEIRAIAQSSDPQTIPPPLNALIFCIYFGAVVSLTPEACELEFGENLDTLTSRHRILAERALAAADYLNTNDLRTLQAFTIYICMLRCQFHGRASWSLTALLVRLAQAMNLHRDGDGHRFSPFEAEMRRRLWGFILVLDIRASEDRGTENIVLANTFDTAPPTPIDDADFSPSSSGPLTPKSTPADNVVSVCMVTCSSIFGVLLHQPPKLDEQLPQSIYTEDDIISQVRRLETNFVHSVDHTHLPSLYASEIARVVILKLWLACQYPFSAQPPIIRPNVSRETMLRTALSVMELTERMQLPPWKGRFSWWANTYVQWHPLAVTLAELCVRTEGDLVDRAWEVVERVYPLWRGKIADTARGTLWRPIKKLMNKAKAARAASVQGQLNRNERIHRVGVPATTATQPQEFDFPLITTESVRISSPLQTDMQVYENPDLDPTTILPIPQNLINLYFDEPGFTDQDMDLTLWNEFLMDTQLEESPEGSGSSG